MESILDHNLLARVLLTMVSAGYGLGLVLADVNNTHVTNPLWTPHARFHCVWQVASYCGLALVALGLIWLPGPMATARLYLAGGLGAIVFLSFLLAYATMQMYGGANHDVNGHLPKPVRLFGGIVRFDANTTVFSVLSLILVGGLLAIKS